MTDYRRMLKLAGLDEATIEQLAMEREQQDADDAELDRADQRNEWERGIEKNIQLIARQTGVELWDNYAVYIGDDNECEVRVDTGSGMPLAHLLQFANKIAAAGLGSDVKVAGSADLFITLRFKLIQ